MELYKYFSLFFFSEWILFRPEDKEMVVFSLHSKYDKTVVSCVPETLLWTALRVSPLSNYRVARMQNLTLFKMPLLNVV